MSYQENNRKPKVKYRDLDFSFFRNPLTNDVSSKTNEEAIKASVRHLCMTSKYERLFQPQIQGGVLKKLFEQATPQMGIRLKSDLEDLLNRFEPRIKLKNLSVGVNNEQNSLAVFIEYTLTNETRLITQTVTIDRIR